MPSTQQCRIVLSILLLLLQAHVVQLGKISLDCIIIGEVDLGRVCHCLGALSVCSCGCSRCQLIVIATPPNTD